MDANVCWLDQNSQQGEAFWVEEEKGWARSGRPGRQSGAGARAQGSESRSRTQGQTSGSLSYVSSPKAELSGQPGRPQSERLGQLQRNLVKGTRRVGRAPGEGLGLRGSFLGLVVTSFSPLMLRTDVVQPMTLPQPGTSANGLHQGCGHPVTHQLMIPY